MKTLTYLLLTSLIILSSCGGIKTKSAGLENESYLEFVGPVKSKGAWLLPFQCL